MPGIVYLLTNQAMPGLVKVGHIKDSTTKEPRDRMKELYYRNSGVPVPFECYYACEVEDAKMVETKLLTTFSDNRINKKREFLAIEPEKLKTILQIAPHKDVTPTDSIVEDQEDINAINRTRSMRRSSFQFSMVGIGIGDELSFKSNKDKVAKVVSDNKIEFEGEVYSLSSAAKKILNDEGSDTQGVSGPIYWMYEGETLNDRRTRMEADDE